MLKSKAGSVERGERLLQRPSVAVGQRVMLWGSTCADSHILVMNLELGRHHPVRERKQAFQRPQKSRIGTRV